jgi:hypothetical protein
VNGVPLREFTVLGSIETTSSQRQDRLRTRVPAVKPSLLSVVRLETSSAKKIVSMANADPALSRALSPVCQTPVARVITTPRVSSDVTDRRISRFRRSTPGYPITITG